MFTCLLSSLEIINFSIIQFFSLYIITCLVIRIVFEVLVYVGAFVSWLVQIIDFVRFFSARECEYSYFKCDGGYKCLYYGFLCNDVIDCLDGTDENRDTCKSELV